MSPILKQRLAWAVTQEAQDQHRDYVTLGDERQNADDSFVRCR